MASIKTVTVTARPSKKDSTGPFWSTSFMLFGSLEEQGAFETEISGSTAEGVREMATRWARTLDLPEEFQGWSLSVAKPARWPAGFKAAFERNSFIVQVREAS